MPKLYDGDPLLCRKCKVVPLGEKTGSPKWCRGCMREYQRAYDKANRSRLSAKSKRWRERTRAKGGKLWHEKFPEKLKQNNRRSNLAKFGLTVEDYDALVAAQEGKCFICGRTENGKRKYFSVDHCHTTGKVRGLLCFNCNCGIGHLRESPLLLRKAASYLESSRET